MAVTPHPELEVDQTSEPLAARNHRRFFGDYELLEEIARGGMGIIYRARQLSLDRIVAVKMVNNFGLQSAAARMRFEIEAGAIASLDHPNIISLYESGEHDGQLFYSMRYVAGGSLLDLMNQQALAFKKQILLLAKVTRAVQHAHASGILHRDIKPSNILIDESIEPHLADFGLAKLTADSMELTRTESVLGSPNYMAPEQASQSSLVTTAADIYSLGAILYQILTGSPPFHADTPLETMRRVVDEEPTRPSQIRPSDRDLEVVCLKCLEKEPDRRYSSARALGDELDRWLDGQPVHARPVGVLARSWRWARRQPTLAAALTSAVLLLVGATVISTTSVLHMKEAKKETEAFLFEMQLDKVDELHLKGKTSEAMALLAKLTRLHPDNDVLGQRLANSLRYSSLPVSPAPNVFLRGNKILTYQLAGDDEVLIAASNGSIVRIDQNAGRILDASTPSPEAPTAAAIASKSLATAFAFKDGTVQLFDANGTANPDPFLHHARVSIVALSPDGSRLAAVVDEARKVVLWDVPAGRPIWEPVPLGTAITAIEFSEDGQLLAACAANFGARVWWAESGKHYRDCPDTSRNYNDVDISIDNELAAFSAANGPLAFWDLPAGESLPFDFAHRFRANGIRLSHDKQLALSFSGDRTAKLWDLKKGRLHQTLPHADFVSDGNFSDDGNYVVTSCHDGTARVWAVHSGKPLGQPMIQGAGIQKVTFGSQPGDVRSFGWDGTAWKWSVGGRLHTPKILIRGTLLSQIRLSHDGRFIAVASKRTEGSNNVSIIDPTNGDLLCPPLSAEHQIATIALSHDSRILAVGGGPHVDLWETDTGQFVKRLSFESAVTNMAFSPATEGLLAVALEWHPVWIGQALGEELEPWRMGEAGWSMVKFTNDGRYVVTASDKGLGFLWDTATRKRVAKIADGGATSGIVESAGIIGVLGGFSSYLWDISRGDFVSGWMHHLGEIKDLAVSPNGHWVATGSTDQFAQLWRKADGRIELWRQLPHEATVNTVAFNSTSNYLATGTDQFAVRLWDVETGHLLTERLSHETPVKKVIFDPHGRWLITATETGTVTHWPLAPPPRDAPSWLPDLAEFLARRQANELGHTMPLEHSDLVSCAQRLRDAYRRLPDEPLLRWYAGQLGE